MSEQPIPKKSTLDEQIVALRQQHEQLLANVHAIEGAIKAFEMIKNGDIIVNIDSGEEKTDGEL